MSIKKDHEIYKRRAKSNMMLGLVLGGFVVIVFGITLSKMMGGQNMEAFDHVRRPALEYAK